MSISRRTFLRLSALGALSASTALLGACAPTAPTAPSKPAEAVKPAEAAPTLAAPAAPAKPADAAKPAEAAKPAAAAEKPQSGGELVVGLWQEPLSLDPVNANTIALRPGMLIYDTLILQSNDFKYHPSLAESWEVAPDGKAYTFKLKKNVKFHDGTPFNAQAVKANFDRIASPDAKATFSVSIRGLYQETQVVDDLTAKVLLSQAFAPFLDGCAEAFFSMVSPTAVAKLGKDFDRNPVGTGPFIFQEWASKSHVALKKNPDYAWGSSLLKHQDAPYLDKVSFRLITESATRLATLETGEIQLAEEIPPIEVDRLKQDSKYQILSQTYPGGPAQMQINTSKAPLDDLKVRQALEYAVNQSDVVKLIFAGAYTPALTPMSAGTFGYDESLSKLYGYDPTKAKELLDQAGWTAGADGMRQKDGKPLEFSVNVVSEITDQIRGAELLQAQFQEVGIKVNIQQLDTGAWNAAVGQGTQMAVIGWRGASDPDFMRPIFHSANIGKSPLQRTHFKDERLDQLLDEGSREQDRTKRAALYREAQEIILKQALIVPLWDRYNFVGARSNVRDLTVDLRGYPRVNDVWFAK